MKTAEPGRGELEVFDLLRLLIERWKLWLGGSLFIALLALAGSFAMTPVFTARATILPPQQQGSAAAALASLSSVAGLAGFGLGSAVKNPAEQYVSLMQSATVLDRLVDRFSLMKVYEADYRFQARNRLGADSRITIGKRDGLISIEVDDPVPQRAADICNAYIEELRRMTATLAVGEAQQRRVFFDKELKEAHAQLATAQQALEATGFSVGALRAEPRAAAEGYAKLKAEATAAEVTLRMLRGALTESSPEVRRQSAALSELRSQLSRMEQSTDASGGSDYLGKYREYKYRETLFELYARQYEIARVDESRESTVVQVVDPALVPEYKSKPKRSLVGLGAGLAALIVIGGGILIRHFWRAAVRG